MSFEHHARVRKAVSTVSPTLPLAELRTLDEVYGRSMARASITLVMLAIAGALALMLKDWELSP